MRYFILLQGQNIQANQRCPVCNEQVSPEDLTTVRLQMTRSLQEDERQSFVLVHREASSNNVRASASSAMAVSPVPDDGETDDLCQQAFQQLLAEHDPGWHFSRLVRLHPGEFASMLREEAKALRLYRPFAIGAGDTELLPSIDAAVSLLDLQVGATPVAEYEPDSVSQPPWGCRYVDVSSASVGFASSSSAAGAVDASEEVEYDNTVEGADEGYLLESPCASGQPSPVINATSSPPIHSMPSPLMEPSASPSSPSRAPAPEPRTCAATRGGARIISFYQAVDGRLVFLQPFFTKLLLHEHGGRWDQLPACLADLRLERLHELTITEEVRKRYRFLAHLSLGSPAWSAEVDLRGHLCKDTRDFFADDFAKRRQQRLKEKAKRRREDRHSQHMAAEQEEQYYRSLNRSHPSTFVAPPTKEDFAVDLLGREVEITQEVADTAGSEAGAAEGGEAAERAEEDWEEPTLADKIKGKITAKVKAKAKAQESSSYFPALGSSAGASRGNGTSSSAWGAGKGSSKARNSRTGSGGVVEEEPVQPQPVPDAWDEDEPTFGEALEAALLSASSRVAQQTPATAEAEGDSAAAPDTTSGSRKKKGKAAKGTTVRLFG
jgi:hypothetical protein